MEPASHIDSGFAWAIMAASSFSCLILCSIYSAGVFNLIFLDVFNESKALTAWCPAIMSSLLCLAGPLGGIIAKKFSCRTAVIVGGLVSGAGMFLSSFATSFYFLFFTFGVIAGTGFGIAYTPSVVIVGYYFEKYLEIAAGISSSTAGVAIMVFPLLLQYLLDNYSWRGTLLIYSGVFFHLCIFGALMRPPPIVPTLTLEDKMHRDPENVTLTKTELKERPVEKKPDVEVVGVDKQQRDSIFGAFKNVKFSVYCVSYFIVSAGIATVYMHMQAFAVNVGVDRHRSTFLVTLLGICGIFGRATSGFILYYFKLPSLLMYIGYLIITGIATVTLPFYATNYTGFLIYAGVFGYFGNPYQTFCGPIIIDIVGVSNLAVAYGIAMLIGGISYLLGPPLTGWFYDISLVYAYTFYFAEITTGLPWLSCETHHDKCQNTSPIHEAKPSGWDECFDIWSGACFLAAALTAIFCTQCVSCSRVRKMEYSTVSVNGKTTL